MTSQHDEKSIYVTEPFLPDMSEFIEIIKGSWESRILTHNGPLVQRLELGLQEKLGVNRFVSVTNGTIALQLALRVLGIEGEVITTPFSWVASISALKWERCTPVFCDIDPETLNIDVNRIEEKITTNTSAIMPVHVFGSPCDVKAINDLAKKYDLKVIYDAAHALGSKVNGSSVLEYGDISATSLHATKIFNTAEGGGCISSDPAISQRLECARFFGHNASKEIIMDGTNAKMNEIVAALGLANLKYYEEILEDRKIKYKRYLNNLSSSNKIRFQKVSFDETNFSYFPIICENSAQLEKIETILRGKNIFPRRYFFPSLNNLNDIVTYERCPISEDIASRILCLPLHSNMNLHDVDHISHSILAGT